MAYEHTNGKGVKYYLHKSEVTLRGGKPQTIYFFTKQENGGKGTPQQKKRYARAHERIREKNHSLRDSEDGWHLHQLHRL